MAFRKISAKDLTFVETYEKYKPMVDAFEEFVHSTNENTVNKRSNKAGSYAKYLVRALIISSELFGVEYDKDDYKKMEVNLERLRKHPDYQKYNRYESRFPNAAINQFLLFINRFNSTKKMIRKKSAPISYKNDKEEPKLINEEFKSEHATKSHGVKLKPTQKKIETVFSKSANTELKEVSNNLEKDYGQDYSVWKFYKYGLSDSLIKTVMGQINSVFDLIILNKKTQILNKTNRKSAVLKAIDVLEKNVSFFDSHLFENPFILLNFGAPEMALKNIVETHRITSIKQLAVKSSDSLNSLMDRNMLAAIDKIKKSINKDYYIENSNIIMKSIILYKMFKLRKVEIKKLTDMNKLFPEKHYNNLDVSINEVQDTIKELISANYILNENDIYYFPSNIYYKNTYIREPILEDDKNSSNEIENSQQVSLKDFLEQDFKDKSILKLRLQGKTLSEIGEIYNVSRERIRQRQNKVIKNMPVIKESALYKGLFEKYSFSKSEFVTIFQVKPEVYEFLSLTTKKGKEDSGLYIINSDKITGAQKKAYLEKHNFYLNRFGELKIISKTEFAEEVIYKNRDKSFNSDTFFELYNQEAENYSNLDLKVGNPRAARALINQSQFTISTFGDNFRYFDLSSTSYDKTLSSIINDLSVGCYSMSKLYNENLELMNQMGLLDEYELHNLFKRKTSLLDKRITLNRSPEFTVGKMEKKYFIQNIFMRFSGRPVDDCVDYLYKRFGFRKNTMKAYLSTNFRIYINDNIIIKVKKYDEDNIEKIYKIRSVLVKPIYLKNEVEAIFDEVGLNLDTFILGKLDYYMTGNIIYRRKFGNVTKAFNSQIMKSDIWKRGNSAIEQSNEMSMHLSQMERNKKLVVISEDTYAKMEFLEEKGLNPLLIEDFIESIYNFLPPSGYFSLHSLNEQGFNHPLFDQGFEKIFYERLITTSSLFKVVNRNSPLLFTKATTSSVTIKKFLLDELSQYELGIDIYDFRDEIISKYNIEFEVADIKVRLQESDVYYSKNLEKLYLNKEIFLDEVYK